MINPSGAITGWYTDSNNASHGFVRAPDGTITEFDVPGDSGGTVPYGGINPSGTVAGYYCDSSNCYGFLRSPKGHFTKFSVSGARLTARLLSSILWVRVQVAVRVPYPGP